PVMVALAVPGVPVSRLAGIDSVPFSLSLFGKVIVKGALTLPDGSGVRLTVAVNGRLLPMPVRPAVPVAVMVVPSVPVAFTVKVVFTVAACAAMPRNILL